MRPVHMQGEQHQTREGCGGRGAEADVAAVYIIQPYREQEICARACQEAQGHECQCSCMGANHGIGNDGSWFEVSDKFSTRWGERELACRLLTAR